MSDGIRLVYPGDSLRSLSSDLATSSQRVGAKAAKAVRDGAKRIANDAKRAAPRNTGALAASIKTSTTGDGRSGTLSATVEPTVRYAPFVEFGTFKDAPQPFLFPAMEKHEGDILREIADAIDEAL